MEYDYGINFWCLTGDVTCRLQRHLAAGNFSDLVWKWKNYGKSKIVDTGDR
jgi:hypothetical protein